MAPERRRQQRSSSWLCLLLHFTTPHGPTTDDDPAAALAGCSVAAEHTRVNSATSSAADPADLLLHRLPISLLRQRLQRPQQLDALELA